MALHRSQYASRVTCTPRKTFFGSEGSLGVSCPPQVSQVRSRISLRCFSPRSASCSSTLSLPSTSPLVILGSSV